MPLVDIAALEKNTGGKKRRIWAECRIEQARSEKARAGQRRFGRINGGLGGASVGSLARRRKQGTRPGSVRAECRRASVGRERARRAGLCRGEEGIGHG